MRTRKTNHLIKLIIDVLVFAIFLFVFAMFLFSLFYKIFGFYKTDYIVETKNKIAFFAEDEMMNPIIKKDDLIVLEKISNENDVKNGDIVYITESESKKLARIDHFRIENNEKKYITKGIKNIYYNKEDITIDKIEAKYTKKYTNKLLITMIKISISKPFSIIISIFITVILVFLIRNKKRTIKRNLKRQSYNT